MKFRSVIEGYGFKYSYKLYLFSLLLFVILIAFVCWSYALPFACTLGLILLSLCCLPFIIISQYKWLYEQKRFDDLCVYMEQIMCSFQKRPKILVALKDARSVAEGNMARLLDEAISIINESKSSDVYEKALAVIENEYKSNRLKVLHNFLIKIENTGGSYGAALNILHLDFHDWQQRTFLYQRDRMKIKRYATIGIVLSFLITSITLYIKKYCDITNEYLYILTTSIFIAGSILFFLLIQNKLIVSWIEPVKNNAQILRDYQLTTKGNWKKTARKSIKFYIVIFGFGVLVSGIAYLLSNKLILLIGLVILIFSLCLPFVPALNIKSARRRTYLELRSSFSEWLRDVSIELQYGTLQNSIELSLPTCPTVLKEPVSALIDNMKSNPGSAEVFYKFLNIPALRDVESSVKMLYSLSETGGKERDSSLEYLIQRNYIMINDTEIEKRNASISALKFIVLIPLFMSSFKLIMDMMLFLNKMTAGL